MGVIFEVFKFRLAKSLLLTKPITFNNDPILTFVVD